MSSVINKALIVSIGCGVILACVMLSLGFLHNSQTEFYLPDGAIDFKYGFGLFGIWFVVGASAGFFIFSLFCLVLKALTRKRVSDS